jgi:hypothetical protein
MPKCTCDSSTYDWEQPEKMCPDDDPDGEYVCTRPIGHEGDHATCFRDDCKSRVWPNISVPKTDESGGGK